MFKKSNVSIEVEDPDKLQVFKNITKSGIFRVVAHPTLFPCANSITWILKNIYVNEKNVCNTRKDSISSYKLEYLAKCYHIEKGIKRLDSKLLSEFE
jgi:hypothetical protein